MTNKKRIELALELLDACLIDLDKSVLMTTSDAQNMLLDIRWYLNGEAMA